jgi:hypothetical protein
MLIMIVITAFAGRETKPRSVIYIDREMPLFIVKKRLREMGIEPLYPRAPDARAVVGRAPGAAWTLMQRADHPDPAAANAQVLQDLENGARGLTLVFAGSVSANGYGLDASPDTLARVLDGVALDAGIAIDFNLSPPTRDAVRHFAALVKRRKLAPGAVDLRASINPIGGFAASGASPRPWPELAKTFVALVASWPIKALPARWRRAHHPQCGQLSGSARLTFAIASAVSICAPWSERRAARCGAPHV